MYSLFLVVGVALVILSPLALELFLTAAERRAERASRLRRRRVIRAANAKGPGIAWAPARLR
ncbi:MAG TPA: hypothetical protein VKV02_11600 [Acidobacteriaceae bacterium]|nr:hypothetical protein [Acidobacteriaceae bacterium]